MSISIILGFFYFIKPFSTKEIELTSDNLNEEVLGIQVDIQEYTVTSKDTFTTVMSEFDITYSDALTIVKIAEGTIDLTKIKAGKVFRLITENGVKTRIEYEPGTETMFVIDLLNDFSVSEIDIPYDISVKSVEVIIEDSLFISGINAGLSEVLLLQFVEIFAWEIDFATQVQKGDSFTIVYEERSRNSISSGVGDILHGSFTNSGEKSEAYRFIDTNSEIGFYNENGESLVRAFLKAPLDFARISSGYTNARFHPTLQSTMPHRAIDYAAPMGTPIKSVADGKVSFAGWQNGHGNYIDIRHGSVYETQYAHLSRIAVNSGQNVKQGDIIGYVGSTGYSTGPHLHYQVKVHGELMNPLEVEFPKGESISNDQLDEFYKQKEIIVKGVNNYTGSIGHK